MEDKRGTTRAGGTAAGSNHEPSMADWLEESSVQSVQRGDILNGRIVSKAHSELIIDIGLKSEGVVSGKELEQLPPDFLDEMAIGDVVPVYVIRPEDEEGNVVLSISRAQAEKDWARAQALLDAGEVFQGKVSSYNKGGLIVNFGLARGFVPGSQLISASASSDEERQVEWSKLVGKKLYLKVIELDRRRNRLIFSEKAAEQERRKEKRAELLLNLSEGDVISGRVISLAEFGAFVDLGGADGLIHLSELSWTRVSHPSEVLKVGDEIEVKVIKIEEGGNRIGLSLKQLQPEPWSDIFKKYEVGQVIDAQITKLATFGAFARLDEAIEGLIHISELSDGNVTHPREVVQEGSQVQVRIIRIDPERKRIGLSMKQAAGTADWEEYRASEEGAAADEQVPAEEATTQDPEIRAVEGEH